MEKGIKEIITKNYQETQAFGEAFAQRLKGAEVLALYGDLGSGKTTFIQGLAKGLGITRKIISPTFIIMRTYKIRTTNLKQMLQVLYHLDLYRIENKSQAIDLGLKELMGDPENIVVIEWPDKIEDLLPQNRITIYFEYVDDKKRKIRIG